MNPVSDAQMTACAAEQLQLVSHQSIGEWKAELVSRALKRKAEFNFNSQQSIDGEQSRFEQQSIGDRSG